MTVDTDALFDKIKRSVEQAAEVAAVRWLDTSLTTLTEMVVQQLSDRFAKTGVCPCCGKPR